MQYCNRNTGAVLPREQIKIRGVANPMEDMLAEAGWLPVVPFELPEGHVKIAGTQTWEEYDGAFFEQHETETTEAHEARQAAEREAQAFNDAVQYSGAFERLAQALSVFTGIEEGMTYQQIADLMDAHIQANPDQAGVLAARSLRAMQIFEGVFEPAGIVNERFWRALGAAQMLGGGQ